MSWSELKRAGRLERAGSKLGGRWSKGSQLEQAAASWSELEGWRELGASWEAGESWERAGSKLERTGAS